MMDPLNKIPPSEKKHSWCVEKWFREDDGLSLFYQLFPFEWKGLWKSWFIKQTERAILRQEKDSPLIQKNFSAKWFEVKNKKNRTSKANW